MFVDFKKAFNTVDRTMFWKVMKVFRCPDYFVEIINQFNEGMKGRVVIGSQESDHIEVNHGIKQGCVLALTLFTLCTGTSTKRSSSARESRENYSGLHD